MSRKISRLTVDTLADLPESLRTCLAWELDPVERRRHRTTADQVAEKEDWLTRVLLEWGSCGRVIYVDDVAAGVVQYAPPSYFPGTVAMPTAPVPEDAVQLATAFVHEDYARQGLGRLLMQLAVKDLIKRGGYRAVECFGTTGPVLGSTPGLATDCCLPVEFLRRVGFRTARPHPTHPRMRLDLRSVVTWRSEVELAWERLLGAVRPVSPAPAPTTVSRSPVEGG